MFMPESSVIMVLQVVYMCSIFMVILFIKDIINNK